MTRPDAEKSPIWRDSKGKTLVLNFRDMSFCASDCRTKQCARHFDELDSKAAKAWWGPDGDAPVAFQDFSPGCPQYTKGETNMPTVVKEAIKCLKA